ncbi:hypothetical protein F5884DRAFT_856141 [Xylogone sp. PMI_703]|nr:hypothetical protein F5884DRAFT_856141 [Xylogone sp. PMI_703]
MPSVVRTRTGCEACRRRKKCDERKPQCAVCTRLGIYCETSRPSYKFVNGTTVALERGRKSRRSTRHKDCRTDEAAPHNSRSPVPNTNEGHTVFLQPQLYVSGEESIHPGCDLIDRTEISTRQRHTANLTRRPSSAEDSTSISTPPYIIDEPASYLTAWFSCFVDLHPSIASAVVDGPEIKTSLDNTFYELQEKLYICHWRTNLLHILPAPFKQVESLTDGCEALRPAIIALSACDLAQSRTDVHHWTIKNTKQWLFSPNREHQNYGKVYYGIAKRKLAMADYNCQDPTSLLALLMLFAYIESHIGSYRGSAFHHHGIEHLLSSTHDICKRSTLSRDLVRIWISLRAQNWRHRIPYTMLDFEKSLLDLGLHSERLFDPLNTQEEAVVVYMLECWRLSLMTLFERYAGRGDMESISSRCCRDYYQRIHQQMVQPWRPKVPIPDEDYRMLLNKQRPILDQWYAALPPSDLPFERTPSLNCAPHPLQLDQPPLNFRSRQATMNYIYYIAARIFQSSEAMEEFLSMSLSSLRHNPQLKISETNRWLLLLLRTIVGLDITSCARYSYYSVGILEILVMCSLRLPQCSHIIQMGINYMVDGYIDNCVTHEGSSLVLAFQRISEMIEKQRNRDWDLFYVMPHFSPDSQRLVAWDDTKQLVVYGRDRATGKLFCQLLPATQRAC